MRLLLGSSWLARVTASTTDLQVGGATIDVALGDGFALPRDALLDWVKHAAVAVSGYFGRFPVPKAGVRISGMSGKGVSNGRSFANHGAQCRISVGYQTSL